jgi:hypothetical protein
MVWGFLNVVVGLALMPLLSTGGWVPASFVLPSRYDLPRVHCFYPNQNVAWESNSFAGGSLSCRQMASSSSLLIVFVLSISCRVDNHCPGFNCS